MADGSMLPVGNAAASAGSDVVYGVRPEHFSIVGEGALPVTVSLVEPMGSDTQITGRAGNEEIIALFHSRVAAQPGEVLHLLPQVAETHLFEAANGQRIN